MARNVWLPGAGVWACLEQDCGDGGDGEKGDGGRRGEMELPARKRRRRKGDDGASDGGGAGLGLGFCGSEEEQSTQDVVVCPICLEAEGEAVLQWCMHRFCTHCIEEWSKVRRVCPLCKAEYRGWYHGVRSNDEFQERLLPSLAEPSTRQSHGDGFRLWRDSRRWERGRGKRPLQPRGHGSASSSSSSLQGFGRSAPFPTQRSFGLPRQPQSAQAMRFFEEQAAARALQWRKSVYNRNLRARPFGIGKRSMVTKERTERRLEPWIRRELQAVLPNSDHAFLVRLVLGLWFGAEHESIHLAERQGRVSGQRATGSRNVAAGSTEVDGDGVGEAEAIRELKRFLGDKAELFWHELRCFAESPFTIQAYDTVVVYSRQDNLRRFISRTDGRSSHQDNSLDSRRRSESTAPRLTSRPLSNEEPGHLENNHQILRAGRHSVSQSCAPECVQSSIMGQHRKDNLRNSVQTPQALLVRDSRAEQRKKRSHMDAEDRWQLSYC